MWTDVAGIACGWNYQIVVGIARDVNLLCAKAPGCFQSLADDKKTSVSGCLLCTVVVLMLAICWHTGHANAITRTKLAEVAKGQLSVCLSLSLYTLMSIILRKICHLQGRPWLIVAVDFVL